MKPQIVSQEYGLHNKDLDASSSRIMKGGTWKRQRIILIIPAADMIPAKIYLNHCSLIMLPNQAAHRMLALGQEVGDAYTNAIQAVLDHPELSQWEYICTLEHDNAPPPDGLIRLVARMEEFPQYAAISGLYWTKGEGGVPQIWGRPDLDPVQNYRPCPPEAGKVVEAYGIGMGFALWRLNMFKDDRLRKPWFETKCSREGVGTQDLAFCADARKYGYKFGVDCGILVGHYDHQTDTMW